MENPVPECLEYLACLVLCEAPLDRAPSEVTVFASPDMDILSERTEEWTPFALLYRITLHSGSTVRTPDGRCTVALEELAAAVHAPEHPGFDGCGHLTITPDLIGRMTMVGPCLTVLGGNAHRGCETLPTD